MSRNILLGVCGGIAAYKSAELVRALQKQGMDVRVVMTKAAEEFVRPLTFASLTSHKVFTDLWDSKVEAEEAGFSIEHITQAQWADLLLIAPATANTMAKFAQGLADDFLSATYLATTAPVVFAPAMNVNMWNHPATQTNLVMLQQRGHRIVEPESGYLACGMTGSGRFPEIETIVEAVLGQLQVQRDLAAETVLITAGGTREPIDPVRFLGNRSSGKMGYALAEAAQRRGARVILVTAPTALATPEGCEVVRVTTAAEMQAAVLAHLPEATAVIKAAAVADFRMKQTAATKLERRGSLTLELEPTDDIVRSVVEARRPGTLVIAFAAEMGRNLERAREKLLRKGADAIVVNDVAVEGLGFDSDRNAATLLTRVQSIDLPESSKRELAERILDEMLRLRALVPGIEAREALSV
ncbi:bifunctional phosphopantothenoylcysteine decarboxylase/phosphopantothenate--cysteine ligase CoaBC [Granulicella mallensis]|uniref:Coenzyme A biosynthesis bifunctional protein CoaBC n=1 Tax=Granulicella mallensis TaxID=940614 RepID=A0A7W8EBW0_9BACT|nr:bifunctional phosphopantothenoylcysteine decarboxylase/phosphopantothenate--cysteine ligase CoaBC [Granulicella mallensis]MBB5065989.1 phosphopantothenoylcysteine decarboxylase/phosphopantothenate--cysteine ligase [Granulicella mallensis]